ncbi:MAG: DUF3750 domain-containing protein [Gammaproteobacteria bacterium]|nr:DUF3750 domain-containing protein [Gammaproteobacteria bacterium]MCP5443871.1 DUF3750 domain-containing protein [Chromatiaceae bacterium]
MQKKFIILRKPLRLLRPIAVLLFFLLLGPFAVLAFGDLDMRTHWRNASHASSGLAPSPDQEPQAVIQIYGARAYNWRGAFGIHTWIAAKRRNSGHYTVYQVIGWNLYRGHSVVTVQKGGTPDFRWFNAQPELLLERRGGITETLIDRIESAVDAYPYAYRYRVWPGPNSNSFTAFVARKVPELGLDLPPTAIGKDFLAEGKLIGPTPSGTGWQFSLFGLLGASLASEEGLEFNLLGLSFGFDANDLALRLPGFGRVLL